jgi:hypothetical protein
VPRKSCSKLPARVYGCSPLPSARPLTTKKPAPSIAASVGELLLWSSPCWSIR